VALLAACVVSLLATFMLTWPLWNARAEPPHLPIELPLLPTCWLSAIQIPFGWILVGLLPILLVKPKPGLAIHAALFGVACLFDRHRLLPQIGMQYVLMAALVYEPGNSKPGPRLVRWFLAIVWIWTGFHKLISADWWGYISWTLLARLDFSFDLTPYHVGFAAIVCLSEISLGVLAIFKPKQAAWFCLALHLGIALFLSPFGAGWNYSVIPWNIATAIIGAWVLRREPTPLKRIEVYALAALAIIPIGFYAGITNVVFAHVLYSGNTPSAMITTSTGSREIVGWKLTDAPFPESRSTHAQHFQFVAEPGDKLHIADPRWLLGDLYYHKNNDGNVIAISREEFLHPQDDTLEGALFDSRDAAFQLTRAGALMLRREEFGPIYAIAFEPKSFESNQLQHLKGLPNIEQVELSGTDVTDDDLRMLQSLIRLEAIAINNTSVTDKGIMHLKENRKLELIQHAGTEITDAALNELGVNQSAD